MLPVFSFGKLLYLSLESSITTINFKVKITRKQLFLYLAFLVGAFLLAGLLVALLIRSRVDIPNEEMWSLVQRFYSSAIKWPFFYLFLQVPYLSFLLIRSWWRDYQRNAWRGFLKGISLKGILPFLLIWLSLKGIDAFRTSDQMDYKWDYSIENQTDRANDHFSKDGKHRGIHVFDLQADSTDLNILKTSNVEWITFTPFIPQDYYDQPQIVGEYDLPDSIYYFQSWERKINWAKAKDFKVMIKPHIWLVNTDNGKWRSDIAMHNEADWEKWFGRYEFEILAFAELAQQVQAEAYCIGTELQQTAIQQPERWRALIRKVRLIYDGTLVYAANWNEEVEQVPFWDDLDYIGVQAYYPLANQNNPSLAALEKGWEGHYPILQSLSKKYNKKILFTELGYKSTPDAGRKPWAWNNFGNRFYKPISHRTQAHCYQAFFNTVWQQEWMAGVHIWEWQTRGQSDGQNNAFTLEGKPALNVVAKGFYVEPK